MRGKLQLLMFITSLSLTLFYTTQCEEITPFKYVDEPPRTYTIPQSSRFSVQRTCSKEPNIIYYLSKPNKSIESYPIALLCGGSSLRDDIKSIIHFHRYFLDEFRQIGMGVLTVEQWGVDGNKVDADEFMKHYTLIQRLNDHRVVIDYLLENPPKNWNKKFIFLGVSEGGPLVTNLTEIYPDSTTATINWCGAGDWSWRDELWDYLQSAQAAFPWWMKLWRYVKPISPKREEHDCIMDQAINDPTVEKEYLGMTYKYHAASLTYPATCYENIQTPFLVVTGDKDPLIASSDDFVRKALKANAPVTYFRIPGMDHYIRYRPDVIDESFIWLKNLLRSK